MCVIKLIRLLIKLFLFSVLKILDTLLLGRLPAKKTTGKSPKKKSLERYRSTILALFLCLSL